MREDTGYKLTAEADSYAGFGNADRFREAEARLQQERMRRTTSEAPPQIVEAPPR
jgi:hypothetical protein